MEIYNPPIDTKRIDQIASELVSGATVPMTEEEMRAELLLALRKFSRSSDAAVRAEKRYHTAMDELRATQERVIAMCEAHIWAAHPDWKRESKATRGRVRGMARAEAEKLRRGA